MTLLQELTRDALHPSVEITGVLRKARVLAARLKNAEFETWIKNELNSYPPDAAVPEYRILTVHSKAHLIFPGWVQMPEADVMASQIPEDFRHWATTFEVHMPVTELASLAAGFNSDKHKCLTSPWPQELAVRYGAAGYGRRNERIQCIKAWRIIGGAQLIGIIETVRNKLLDFVLQIEAEAPGAGEAAPGQIPLALERVTQHFYTIIQGGVNHVGRNESHGGSNSLHIGSMQDSQIQQGVNGSTQTFMRGSPERGDLEKLVYTLSEHLHELNLEERARKKSETQLATIKAQLEDDEPDSMIIAQAGKTLRSLTEGVIGNFIASALQPPVWHWVGQFMQSQFPK
jgi:hypothetical protein